MTTSVVVKGGPRFEATLGRAAHDIAVLRDGFADAGRIVADAAAGIAPVRTGTLAASIRPEPLRSAAAGGVDITSGLAYANPIHWGVPSHNIAASLFILRGAESSESAWTHAIERDAQRVCDRVQGA
jgi:hypothetical protein